MKRMKTIGVAAIAALALSVGIGAASASASGFLSDQPANLSGVPTGTFALATNMGIAGNCYTTLTGSVTKPTESVAMSPWPEISCSSVKVKTNGCTFNVSPGAETAAGVFAGSAEIAGGCSGISFTQSGCTFNFPPQGGLSATFENVGSGATAGFNVSVDGTGLKYVTTGHSGCLPGTYNNGWMGPANWKVSAQGAGGEQTGVHVAHQIGFHVGGQQSEDPAKQPRFKAENYPAGILGEQTTQHLLATSAGNLKCATLGLSGTMSAASPEALLDPEFKTCGLAGTKLKARTNTCVYAFHVANVAGPYSGTLELSCSGSNQLEFEYASGGCTVKFPEQTLAAVSYEDIGFEAERKVVAQLAGEGIEYTLGSGCANAPAGTYTDATLSGASTLEAML